MTRTSLSANAGACFASADHARGDAGPRTRSWRPTNSERRDRRTTDPCGSIDGAARHGSHELEASRVQRLIHRVVSAAYRQWLYDSESLIRTEPRARFGGTRICSYRTGETPDLEQLKIGPKA